MKMRRREAALAMAGFVAAGATKVGAQSSRHPWTIPHTLRYTTASDINTLNPVLLQDFNLGLLGSLTMAWLVRYDIHNQPVPELATVIPTQRNGGISPDGKTITFHLRKGVVWSDGVPFDARDFVFTWKAMMNSANDITDRSGWDLITRIDTPNPYTLVIHLKEPYAAFLPGFCGSAGANPCILPEHILGNLPNINNAPYNSLPVGIGPFKYSSWQRTVQVEMVANDKYWRGRPKLDKVIFRVIPDRNTVVTQLTTHEVDFWYPFGGAYLDRVKAISGVKVLRQPGYIYNHIDMNLSRDVFKDLAVREAVRYAINRPLIRDKVGHGVGIIQESLMAPTHPMYDPHIPIVPFDLDKASKLLDGAGWKHGSDGVRAKNGLRLALVAASTTGTPDADTQIDLIQDWLKQIGIDLEVHRYAPPLFFAPYAEGGVVYGGKFDLIFFAWQNDVVGDLSGIFSSKEIPPNGQNDERYRNPKVDAWLADFRHTYDLKRQRELSWKIQDQVVKDVGTIVTSFREDMYGFNDDLQNFHPNAVTPFDDMMNVDI
ncbi:MAG: peptide ABC transporter substrate-binding protein [Vulcanimicrobiaceae bacterium]|jgi:peptide/nickel transport system substrate-binding protein